MGLRSAFESLLASEEPLSGMDALIWETLSAGALSPKHPWNLGAFSSVDLDEADAASPRSRTVVLRRVDRAKLAIDFHTDVRSAKTIQLKNANACWLFYSPASKIQLRLEGTSVLIDGEEADETWARTPIQSRSSYLSIASPGTVLAGEHPPDTSDRSTSALESERGRVNFRIVRTTVASADWLYLRREGHLRTRLTYHESGACDCHWIVP